MDPIGFSHGAKTWRRREEVLRDAGRQLRTFNRAWREDKTLNQPSSKLGVLITGLFVH